MKMLVDETSISMYRRDGLATSTKAKLLAILEILVVYGVVQTLLVVWHSMGISQWEVQNLGWSYTGMLILVGIPVLVVWLGRRSWAEYGVSSADWRTNLDVGMKAYLVRLIPGLLGWGNDLFESMMWVVGLALMVWILNRHKPVKSARANVIATLLLLLLPICVALAMGRLSVVIVSTIAWQFVLSGFGEEFVFRGYVQSRLNKAFGRPMRLFGIQFGLGLIIASLLFGLLHAFNTYDPLIGFSSLAWGWALSSFLAGVFFGVLRERTGTLVAPGIAHGLPDAVGEALIKILGWV